ncbi:hypothetical protein PQR52_07845 [Paraburkholderia aspalathi]|uniref:hypothetical protein n=1 Tax=Paraburkholderia aspalathi TaxID=1324617 RepID=UPI0038B74F7A
MIRVLLTWSLVLVTFVIACTIFGTVHYFSSIPFEDQWDAYIGFFHSLSNGNLQAWWTPQMEHRIVFSRLLFWLDGKVFGGFNIFSIIATFALMIGLCACVAYECRRQFLVKYEWITAVATIFGFMFLWIQNENFTSGFQNQFVAVYFFAILGYVQFSKLGDHRNLRVVIAILCGILSALSMANGLAALFVMSAQAILMRRPLREVVAVTAVGAVVAAVYLHDQTFPVLAVDPTMAHVHLPILRFFFVFLGSPVTFIWQNNLVAGIFGFFTFCTFSFLVVYLYFARKISPYHAFLIAGYGFVAASGMGASHGRWMLGFDAAHTSRYTTPALLGYVLLLMLAASALPKRRTLVLALSVVFLTLFMPIQIFALGHSDRLPNFARVDLYSWKLAVLGQKIGLDHPELDAAIFPANSHERYIDQADYAALANIGPYGSGWLHDAGIVNFDPGKIDHTLCDGSLEGTRPDNVGRVSTGWVIARKYRGGDVLVLLVDTVGRTMGYGVSGMSRPDIRKANSGGPRDAGWTGFAKSGDGPLNAYAYIGGKFCPLGAPMAF